VNGRCVVIGHNINCTYDDCEHDCDCAAGSTCACHDTAYMGPFGNTCVPGNCRVDADCGPGGYCSPATYGGCSLSGYYCHTASDQCIDDSDCLTSTAGSVCSYLAANQRWECTGMWICD
jgi:hypothetical protein